MADVLQIKSAFKQWDSESSGCISREILRRLLQQLGGHQYTREQVDSMFAEADVISDDGILYEPFIDWLFRGQEDPAEIAAALGFVMPLPTTIEYSSDYIRPAELTCGLLMVPHGQTPSNVGLLFQNHSDNVPETSLTAKGIEMAQVGAQAFVRDYGPLISADPGKWVFYRSPLSRTKTTAEQFLAAARQAGIPMAEPTVDPDLIEISQGSWHGLSVDDLRASGRSGEAEAAQAYRDGSFVARALDGSGECILEVMARAAAWLRRLEGEHGGGRTNVLVFGHGTFQNSVEALQRTYPEKSPAQLFSRVSGGSHLRRGETHVIAALR